MGTNPLFLTSYGDCTFCLVYNYLSSHVHGPVIPWLSLWKVVWLAIYFAAGSH